MLTGNVASATSPSRCSAPASPGPFLLAPVGVLSIAHPEGELAVARAAAATGVPLVLSSAASHSLEEVAAAMGDAPALVPALLGPPTARSSPACVDRAAAAGYGAIVVTLDTLPLGWRAARPPRRLPAVRRPATGCAQFFTDPVFRARLAQPPEEDVLTAAGD